MGHQSFDTWTRRLSQARTRREMASLLVGVAGLSTGVGLFPRRIPPVAAASGCAEFCHETNRDCQAACGHDRTLHPRTTCPPDGVDAGGGRFLCTSVCQCTFREEDDKPLTRKEELQFCSDAGKKCERLCRGWQHQPSIVCAYSNSENPDMTVRCTCV